MPGKKRAKATGENGVKIRFKNKIYILRGSTEAVTYGAGSRSRVHMGEGGRGWKTGGAKRGERGGGRGQEAAQPRVELAAFNWSKKESELLLREL